MNNRIRKTRRPSAVAEDAGSLFACHVAILVGGALAGFILAYVAFAWEWYSFAPSTKSADLGIISPTLMKGYSKTRDLVFYASAIILSFAFSIGAWLLWSRNRRSALVEALSVAAAAPGDEDVRFSRRFLVGIAVAAFLVAFNLTWFYTVPGGSPATAFQFEEGAQLEWAQSIFNRGVYGKDFFCIYGPLLVYPNAWVMKLFGETIPVSRFYSTALNLVAWGIFLAFLHRTVRTRVALIVGAVAFLLSSFPLTQGLNMTFLRTISGLAPLLFLHEYLVGRQARHLVATGATLGIVLFFAQETWACSMLAVGGVISLDVMFGDGGRKSLKDHALIGAGFAVVAVAGAILLLDDGSLSNVYRMMIEAPVLIAGGYGDIPLPTLGFAFSQPSALVFYWVFLSYIFAAAYIGSMFLLGHRTPRQMMFVGVLILGGLAFRSALGRSDVHHGIYASRAALLMVILLLDDILLGARREGVSAGLLVARRRVASLLVAFIALYVLICGPRSTFQYALVGTDFGGKFTVDSRDVVAVPEIPRAGALFNHAEAYRLSAIKRFLDARTRPDDFVYFFPNEPAYYFFFDRKNPTIFGHSYLAMTTGLRADLVRQLDERKPRYVIYSFGSTRFDLISERIVVPEVVDYLGRNYAPVARFGDVLALQRTTL